MKIRDFSKSDAETCLRIRAEAFTSVFQHELGADGVSAGLSAYKPADLMELSEQGHSFVVDEDNSQIGFCTIRKKDSSKADLLFIYVKLDRLKEGIGTALVHHAEKWILSNWPEIEWFDIETVVPEYNKGFYESLGFHVVGNTEVQFPAMEVPALLLRKPITSGFRQTPQSRRSRPTA